jgi:tRNA 2-selenouridine synthase
MNNENLELKSKSKDNYSNGIENIQPEHFVDYFLAGTPLIDVRAPIEFELGSLPNAVNLPILNNQERAQVGTIYKDEGNDAAVKLGHRLISGTIKEERIQQWLEFLKKNPEAVLYCFRGGQRSRITQQWLKEAGANRPLLTGGYKLGRQILLEKIKQFSETQEMISVCGPTGSGKTQFILDARSFYPSIDLEGIARHRGSAFGALSIPQPSQIDFENDLAMVIFALEKEMSTKEISKREVAKIQLPVLLEDESRLIGKCILPDPLFEKLHAAPVIWIDEPIEQRVQNIFYEYILKSPIGSMENETALPQFVKFKNSLQSISKKLGGMRTKEVLDLLSTAESDFIQTKSLERNRQWIEKLLVYYYDPLYLKSIEKRNVKVLIKGSKSDCLFYLKSGGYNAKA